MFTDAMTLFLDNRDIYFTGLGNTVKASLISLILALLLGILVAALRYYSRGLLARCLAGYVSVVRNTPLLIQIYFIFFGLPSLGITLSAFETGLFALTFNSTAYVSEIILGALRAIPDGQREAAQALSLGKSTALCRVLLPQSAELAVPAVCGQFVQLIKDTSLLYTISVFEITKAADDVANTTYAYLEAFLVGGMLYLVVCMTLNVLVDLLEMRLRKAR